MFFELDLNMLGAAVHVKGHSRSQLRLRVIKAVFRYLNRLSQKLGGEKMNQENIECDLSKQPIVFVYKETPEIETLVKTCPSCGSRCIYKLKSHTPKQRIGRAKLLFTPACFRCRHCGHQFQQPKEIKKKISRVKPLPMDLQKIAEKKKTHAILSPSEKPVT